MNPRLTKLHHMLNRSGSRQPVVAPLSANVIIRTQGMNSTVGSMLRSVCATNTKSFGFMNTHALSDGAKPTNQIAKE
jgi:hypothetical protein